MKMQKRIKMIKMKTRKLMKRKQKQSKDVVIFFKNDLSERELSNL